MHIQAVSENRRVSRILRRPATNVLETIPILAIHPISHPYEKDDRRMLMSRVTLGALEQSKHLTLRSSLAISKRIQPPGRDRLVAKKHANAHRYHLSYQRAGPWHHTTPLARSRVDWSQAMSLSSLARPNVGSAELRPRPHSSAGCNFILAFAISVVECEQGWSRRALSC